MLQRALRRNLNAKTAFNSARSAGYATFQDQEQTPWEDRKFFVTGANGQIGRLLVKELCKEVGADRVFATDIGENQFAFPCRYEKLDVTDGEKFRKYVEETKSDTVIHLAAILSALGEKNPARALDVNVKSTIYAINIANDNHCRLFLPSSIASFGGNKFQKTLTPVDAPQHPQTIYGVTKVFGEQLGAYYNRKFGLDYRGLRYPAVISSEKFDFSGSACYSTEIFFEALEKGEYKCWLSPKTTVPYLYIDDAVLSTLMLIKADKGRLSRTNYQVAGLSFPAEEWCRAVQKLIPGLKVTYEPDFRDAIAHSWTDSLDDSDLQKDIGWRYDYTVEQLARKVFDNIDPSLKKRLPK